MVDDDEVSEDTLLGGRVRLLQRKRGHRAGTDAVLLAAACHPDPGATVVDLGAASGAVGLMIASRMPDCRIALVERDSMLVGLCRRNVAINGLADRAKIVEADVLAIAAERRADGLVPDSCDLVATNPPFFEDGASRRSPEPARASAHHLPEGGLAAWLSGAADLLRRGGRLILIHRADRLKDCLDGLGGFGGIGILPIYGHSDRPAVRVLISAIKASHAPLTIRPPLVLHEADGRFTAAAAALHRGEANLDWT